MQGRSEDWDSVLKALLDGDRLAFLRVSRLITGFLAQWRAYDFREEWPDLIQEVVVAVVVGAREGKLREPRALPGYVRTITRFKFMDHLRGHLRCREDETLPWEEVAGREEAAPEQVEISPEARLDLRQALDKLPERKRRIVVGVYMEGKTYDQVAEETGTPLGTLKRYLRDCLAELRQELGDAFQEG